ncbi:MAG: DNA damage-inducible protein DinB [Cyclobacteriaceae bacterium]|nr:MAG: DNA damage-inducible protein DinB [Cyclobacteriaceae bacterium]
MKTKADIENLPPFYSGYVTHVAHLPHHEALVWSNEQLQNILLNVSEERGTYAYAPGKWTIKEVLAHIQDAERVFAYRALRFARNDDTALPGFDESRYAPESNAHARPVETHLKELNRLRASTIDLFLSFTPEMLRRTGIANGNRISVLNIAYVIAGHALHHVKILQSRYGI